MPSFWPLKRTPSYEQRKAQARSDAEAEKKVKREKRAAVRLERENNRAAIALNPNMRFPHTQVTYTDVSFVERPPPLEYQLDRVRMKSLIFFWSLVFLDVVCLPLALYFALWYGTNLSHNAVFSISTGALGTVSIVEYFIRFWRLWKKDSSCRVIGAKRHYLDFFHWNLSIAWFAVMLELIIGTVFSNPPIRLLAMPATSMVLAFGVQMIIIDILRYFKVLAPFRISSLRPGDPLRPGIYSIIEDVCAVDGSGGTQFRQRLNLRYLESHYFRLMLHRLTLFWAIGALVAGGATTAIIFTVSSKDAAYVCGWTIPFAWAAAWAALTVVYVKYSLKREYRLWGQERAKVNGVSTA